MEGMTEEVEAIEEVQADTIAQGDIRAKIEATEIEAVLIIADKRAEVQMIHILMTEMISTKEMTDTSMIKETEANQMEEEIREQCERLTVNDSE